jgi:hypothetical protein
MKKTIQLISGCLLLLFIISSCSIEKRKYQPGLHVEWNSSKRHVKQSEAQEKYQAAVADKVIPVAENLAEDETATASADNSISASAITHKSLLRHHKPLPEDCDVILLKNGEEIKGKVTEVAPDEIKYKKCNDENGMILTLKKSDVFMIKYSNGTKDIIAKETSQNIKFAEKGDNGAFGIVSFLSIVAFFLLVGSASAVTLLLIPMAIVFGIIGSERKRKLKGLAIAGLVGGLAIVFLILLFLALFPDGII